MKHRNMLGFHYPMCALVCLCAHVCELVPLCGYCFSNLFDCYCSFCSALGVRGCTFVEKRFTSVTFVVFVVVVRTK